jgi:hypothetical protein
VSRDNPHERRWESGYVPGHQRTRPPVARMPWWVTAIKVSIVGALLIWALFGELPGGTALLRSP